MTVCNKFCFGRIYLSVKMKERKSLYAQCYDDSFSSDGKSVRIFRQSSCSNRTHAAWPETINNSIKYLSTEGYIDKVFITRDNPNFYYSLSITPTGRQYLEDSILNSKRYLYNTWITVITLIATIVSIIISLVK